MGKRAQREATRFDFAAQRRDMVEHHIAARGVRSESVLRAMRAVRREEFLPSNLREFAYEDSPLPIASGQTISQPYIVAFMIEALLLKGGEDVLEIGTGSGYAAAILAEIAKNVYSVERIGQLAEKAATTLAKQGYHNVHVRHGDGTRGWPEHAPYDAIVVAAGGPKVPETLQMQLKVGGPVGNSNRHHAPCAGIGACHKGFDHRVSPRRACGRPFRATSRRRRVGTRGRNFGAAAVSQRQSRAVVGQDDWENC